MNSCYSVSNSIREVNDNNVVNSNSKFKLLKIIDATAISASAILFDMLLEKDAGLTQQPNISDDSPVMELGIATMTVFMIQTWYTGELGLLCESYRAEIENVKDRVKLNLGVARAAVSMASMLLRNPNP